MNEDLIERYQRDGYVVMEDLVSRSEVTELREEAEKLCLERGAGLARKSEATSGGDQLAAYLAIHFPHKLSSLFREALAHPRIVDVLTSLIGPNVKCMQSMLFIKASGKPGQAWHQDEISFRPETDLTGGMDRARRRHDRERLPMGHPRLAKARRALRRWNGITTRRFDCIA